MTDEGTGRQLTPAGQGSEVSAPESAITPVPDAESRSVERFSAGPRAHTVELTEQRSSQIVRQSGNARIWAFLGFLFLGLFIPVYWFYDIGIPALGSEGRLDKEADRQYVTDVARGYTLFVDNCARCHSSEQDPGDGKGRIGPALSEPMKLYNAVTEDGRPGPGHLNPEYLDNVLTVGGRYICGDANSGMPAWKQPNGALNYRQVEELIAWLTASNDVEFVYDPAAHGATTDHPEPVTVRGWRDADWKPAPEATPFPACYRNPSGQIGGAAAAPVATPAAIEQPGTPEAPRVIKLQLTDTNQIADESGTQVTQIAVKPGETVTFQVENTAGYDHNLYIGTEEELKVPGATTPVGIPTFTSGVQTLTWTVPSAGPLQFACTVPGHYAMGMHGDFVFVE